jgi:hypothetical protein
MKSIDQIYASLAPISLASCSLPLSTPPLLPNLHPPPPVVMVSDLPSSRYQSENDLRTQRKAIRWQSPGYDLKMHHWMLSLAHPGYSSTSHLMPWHVSCRHSPPSSSCCWSIIGFDLNICRHTPSCWWRSSTTSVRCSWGCGSRCVCSGGSTCYAQQTSSRLTSAATTSSTG